MWWTCGFTPTQRVSWQLEWYMYTLSYISTHRQTCKVQWGTSSHASYLPSSYSLSLLFPEHDNTQLVYVEFNILLVFWWCRLWRRYIIMLFDLFIFLSWLMWWTCWFTPTQIVSWQLEWYMYTLSYISTHRQTCKVQWGSSSHASYLPSSYSLSLLFPEHDNTQQVYVEFNILLVFWWCRPWSDCDGIM